MDLAGVGIDREPFARHPAERHVRGADRVGAQHDLVERIAGRERHVDAARPCRARRATARARARAARRHDVDVVDRARPRRASPAPRARRRAGRRSPADRARRPRSSARRTSTPGGVGHTRGAPAPRATTPSISTTPSRATATAAIGGRFGPRRTTSSREYTTRTARPKRSASSRAAPRRGRVRLAAERAAVRERRRGLAPGLAPRRVGLEVRGLDPLRRELHATRRARGHPVEQRRARVDRRAPALHLARRGPAPRAATRRRPSAGPRPRPHRRSSPAGAAPRRARRAARCRRRTARRRAARRDRRAARRPPRARPAAPAASRSRADRRRSARRPRSRRARSANRCTGTGARRATRSTVARPARPRTASRSPACRSRTAIRRSRRTRRRARRGAGASSPSIVVTARPSTRATGRHARDARLTVDEHRAATALALRRAPVLRRHDPEPLAQHVQQRFAALDVGIDDDRRAVQHERRSASASRRPYPSHSIRHPDAKRPRRSGAVRQNERNGSGERLAAAAGALRVRVVDREARALEAVLVVERRADEVLALAGSTTTWTSP